MLTNVTRFQKGSLKLHEHAYYYVALFIYYFIGAKVKDSVTNFGSFFAIQLGYFGVAVLSFLKLK